MGVLSTEVRPVKEPAELEELLPENVSEFTRRSSGRSACPNIQSLRFRGAAWLQWFSHSSVSAFMMWSGLLSFLSFCPSLSVNHFANWNSDPSLGFLIWPVPRRDSSSRHWNSSTSLMPLTGALLIFSHVEMQRILLWIFTSDAGGVKWLNWVSWWWSSRCTLAWHGLYLKPPRLAVRTCCSPWPPCCLWRTSSSGQVSSWKFTEEIWSS